MPAEAPSLRLKRARKDRPCDACRRAKHTCFIPVRDQPCARCSRTAKKCTFDAPSTNRHRTTASPSQLRNIAQAEPSSSNVTSFARDESPGSSNRFESRSSPVDSDPMRGLLSIFAESDDEDAKSNESSGDEYYTSLDMEANDIEESHYLGSGAFAHLTMDKSDWPSTSPSSSSGTGHTADHLAYRQVADPQKPVFFLRNPSKVYGYSNAAYAADKAYTSVAELLKAEGSDVSQRLFQTFIDRTLPAVPIFNKVRLEASCYGWQGAGQFPHAIMVGIMAHTSILIPNLRHRCKDLWGILLHLLDNEYRQPRLQTLQLALLDIYGRPHLNHGGNHPALCRALGAAQLLGLHRDCAKWKLPKWERSVRKRIWWSLFIADKWNAFVYGRPSNIPSTTFSIPCPTLADDDWNGMSVENGRSVAVFVASCRLSLVLETLLALSSHETGGTSKDVLRSLQTAGESVLRTLDGLDDLRFSSSNSNECRSAGVGESIVREAGVNRADITPSASFQLDVEESSTQKVIRTISNLLAIVERLVQFLSGLQIGDYNAYWSPWSSTHLSHALSLLLRVAVKLSSLPSQTTLYKRTWDTAHSLVTTIQIAALNAWEVAETALPRMRILVCSMPDLSDSGSLKQLLAPPPQLAYNEQFPLTNELSMPMPILNGANGQNSWDWLGDMDFWTQAGLGNAFSSASVI